MEQLGALGVGERPFLDGKRPLEPLEMGKRPFGGCAKAAPGGGLAMKERRRRGRVAVLAPHLPLPLWRKALEISLRPSPRPR